MKTSSKVGSEKESTTRHDELLHRKKTWKTAPIGCELPAIEVNCGENKSTSNINGKVYLPYRKIQLIHFQFENIPYRRQHNWRNSNLKVQLNQHQSQYALLYRRKIRMAISCLSNSNPCQHTLVKSQDMKMMNLFLTSGGSETKSVTSQPCNILHKREVKKQPKQRSWLEICEK